MKFTNRYNSFEKEIMAPVNQIKYVVIVLVLLNLIVPIYKPMALGFTSVFQWLVCLVNLLVVVGCYGYIPRMSPIIAHSIIRFVQGFMHIRAGDLYIIFFIALCALDIILTVLVMIDKARYDIVCISDGEDD